jgi:hypothetical protein
MKRRALLFDIGGYLLKKDTDLLWDCSGCKKESLGDIAVFLKLLYINKPECCWNLDKAGFSCVTRPSKVAMLEGTKRVYQQTTAEKVKP